MTHIRSPMSRFSYLLREPFNPECIPVLRAGWAKQKICDDSDDDCIYLHLGREQDSWLHVRKQECEALHNLWMFKLAVSHLNSSSFAIH